MRYFFKKVGKAVLEFEACKEHLDIAIENHDYVLARYFYKKLSEFNE